jgi:archaellum component FlaC
MKWVEERITQLENLLLYARKHEQKVWGSGGDHEKARSEIERLEKRITELKRLVSGSKSVGGSR